VTAANIKAVLECEPAITNGFQSRGIKTEPRPDKYHPLRMIELASIDEAIVTALNKPVDARAFVDGLQLPTPIVRRPAAKRKHLDEPGKVVLITGWSQSGKSTLANALPVELGKEKVKVIHQDSFRNHSAVPTKSQVHDGKRSWEGPQFTDWDKLHAAVAEARSTYQLVVVEGYMMLEDEKLRGMATIIIECQVTASVAAERRKSFPKEWPTAERYYMLCVWPAAVQHEGRIADWKARGSVPLHKLCAGGELGARVQRALALLQPLCGGGA
jgi:adenosyl cobinamide kinase/adenosyl cobinamide phosphate guanylyltransferase